MKMKKLKRKKCIVIGGKRTGFSSRNSIVLSEVFPKVLSEALSEGNRSCIITDTSETSLESLKGIFENQGYTVKVFKKENELTKAHNRAIVKQ